MSEVHSNPIAAGQPRPGAPVAPFHVVHPLTGNPLMELGMGDEGPYLRLFDYEGGLRLELCACPKAGVAVEVCNAAHQSMASLVDMGGDGGAVVVFHRPADPESCEPRAILAAGEDGGPAYLELRRADGERVKIAASGQDKFTIEA
jgi:hypothetical protein